MTQAWKQAWDDLQQGLRKGRGPNRWHARPLLLALGQALLEGRTAEAEQLEQQLRSIPAPHRDTWVEAVLEELNLAVTEHVHSADPRYLSRPDYDWGYTLAAREGLEARLRAAEALDIETPPALVEQVLKADERLAPFLNRGETL
jgi:hypothetical protein